MELPRLEPLYAKYKDQGLSIIAVEAFDMDEQSIQFIEDNNLSYTFLDNGKDDEEVVKKVFGVGVFPTSFLIDSDGKIRYMHIGFDEGDEETIEKEILSLLK